MTRVPDPPGVDETVVVVGVMFLVALVILGCVVNGGIGWLL
jgi:hypothetical protein